MSNQKRIPRAVWAATQEQLKQQEEERKLEMIAQENIHPAAAGSSQSPSSPHIPRGRGSVYFQNLLEAPYPLTTAQNPAQSRFSEQDNQDVWRAFKRALVRVAKDQQRNSTKDEVSQLFLAYLKYYERKPQVDIDDILAKLRRARNYEEIVEPHYYS